jgi:hypothetical protein
MENGNLHLSYVELKKRDNYWNVNNVNKITFESSFVGLFYLMAFSIYLLFKYRYYATKFLKKVIQRNHNIYVHVLNCNV